MPKCDTSCTRSILIFKRLNMVQNKGLIFKEPPIDWPIEGKNLAIENHEFDLDTEPPQNGITTKNYYVSFDPYQVSLKSFTELGALNVDFLARTHAKTRC